MDNKQQDALDTDEFMNKLIAFGTAYSKTSLSKKISTIDDLILFIRANFEPKKEQANDKP